MQDSVFNTAQPEKPFEITSKQRAKATTERRRLTAILDFAIRSNRRLTLDIFVPNKTFWQGFANDSLDRTTLFEISEYASIMNDFTSQLAIELGPYHHLYPVLTANNVKGMAKPWHSSPFKEITAAYKAKQAAARATAADSNRDSPAEEEHRALPAPVYLLDKFIESAQDTINSLPGLEKQLASASQAHATATARKSKRHKTKSTYSRPRQRLPSGDKKKLKATLASAQRALDAANRNVGGHAAAFLQLTFMARASSVAGGLNFNKRGIHADIAFDSIGLTYKIRYMKGWDQSTQGLSGQRLPLLFDGATTFPWELDEQTVLPLSDSKSKRNAIMSIIKFAHANKLLDFLNVQYPATQGYRKINAFLNGIQATESLRPEDKVIGGRIQNISSHSLRKAGVSMALATDISAENIRHWVQWRDVDMTWLYSSSTYVVPEPWRSFFSWMKNLPHQNA